jgi:hypothetical protein
VPQSRDIRGRARVRTPLFADLSGTWIDSDSLSLQDCGAFVNTDHNSAQDCGVFVFTDVRSLSWQTTYLEIDSCSTQGNTSPIEFDQESVQLCGGRVPVSSGSGAPLATHGGGPAGPGVPAVNGVFRTRPWCKFSGGRVVRFSLSNQMNRGWRWSVTLPNWVADPKTLSRNPPTYRMQIGGDRNGLTRTAPPLIACTEVTYEISADQEIFVVAGMDISSWKLSQPNQTLPTFKNFQANAIINAISKASGVKIVAPRLNFSVAEEDVKQSNWWDALARIAEIGVCNLLIDTVGTLNFVPLKWTTQPCTFKASTIRYTCDPSKLITGFLINKKTSHYTSMMVPDKPYGWNTIGIKIEPLRVQISNPSAQDISTIGNVEFVSFWTDNPASEGSKLIRLIVFPPYNNAIVTAVQTGVGLAKYMMVGVVPPSIGSGLEFLEISAKLLVSGSTPPTVAGVALPNLDLDFKVIVGLVPGQLGNRPGAVRNESLWPSKAYIIAHNDEILWETDKAGQQVTASGPVDFTAVVGGRLQLRTFHPIPAARIESVSESGDANSFTTSISSFPIPW